MKTATQLKSKTKNLSAATGTPPHIIQRNFLFERFLERAAISEYRDSFIIKGGMLITSIVGINIRATMDLDATLIGRNISESEVKELVNGIIAVKIDDATEFSLREITETRVESDYPGWRVTLNAAFDKIHDTLKLDITVGDVITPQAVEYSYKLMFEDRSISILAYNLETVLAEKFSACISLGTANTRMKDYYDIFILKKIRGSEISSSIFAEALKRTATQRCIDLSDSTRVISEVEDDIGMQRIWKRYQADNKYADGISFADTVTALRWLADWGMLAVESIPKRSITDKLRQYQEKVDEYKRIRQQSPVQERNTDIDKD